MTQKGITKKQVKNTLASSNIVDWIDMCHSMVTTQETVVLLDSESSQEAPEKVYSQKNHIKQLYIMIQSLIQETECCRKRIHELETKLFDSSGHFSIPYYQGYYQKKRKQR
jgi:hypothetical protein